MKGELTDLASAIVDLQLAAGAEITRRYGEIGRQRCLEDTMFHLNYLYQATDVDDASLFLDYVSWAKTMLLSRGIREDDLSQNLGRIRDVLGRSPEDRDARAARMVADAMQRLPSLGGRTESFIGDDNPLAATARSYLELLLTGRRREAEALITDEAQKRSEIIDIYLLIFEPVQRELGRLWQMNQISVAQEHFCTAATQAAMARLYPIMFSGQPSVSRMVATCAGDELHEIGLRMVTDLLEMDGWDTTYLGANVPEESVISIVIERKATLLAISTTITANLRRLRKMIELVRSRPALSHVAVIVGGYPFRVSGELAAKISADGYANDAREAVALARTLRNRNAAN